MYGLTQAEVAQALGTTQAYVSKSESGERRMDAVELYDFARVYGAPLETLLPPSRVRRLIDAGTSRRIATRAPESRPRIKTQARSRAKTKVTPSAQQRVQSAPDRKPAAASQALPEKARISYPKLG